MSTERLDENCFSFIWNFRTGKSNCYNVYCIKPSLSYSDIIASNSLVMLVTGKGKLYLDSLPRDCL